eukprot:5524713-Pyramimonas_sp.AAC.1
MDANGDGYIDHEDLTAATVSLNMALPPAEVAGLLKRLALAGTLPGASAPLPTRVTMEGMAKWCAEQYSAAKVQPRKYSLTATLTLDLEFEGGGREGPQQGVVSESWMSASRTCGRARVCCVMADTDGVAL